MLDAFALAIGIGAVVAGIVWGYYKILEWIFGGVDDDL